MPILIIPHVIKLHSILNKLAITWSVIRTVVKG